MEQIEEDKKPISDASDEGVLFWAHAEIDTLAGELSWAGWGFSSSAIREAEADWRRRSGRIAAAKLEAVKRGLVPADKW